jgi:hypothetical protein
VSSTVEAFEGGMDKGETVDGGGLEDDRRNLALICLVVVDVCAVPVPNTP